MHLLDAFTMSLGAIVRNKLRSVLTLVGIVAGVASIIAVMTAISVVQSTMEKEMSVLGAQVFQVQKWPAGFNSDGERRRAMRRPPLTVEHANTIREQVSTADLVGAEIWDFGYSVEYRGESTNPNSSIVGGTPDLPGPFRHRNQHDVHDADPGNDQRNDPDNKSRELHALGHLVELGDQALAAEEIEIVLFVGLQTAFTPHQLPRLF